MRSQLSLPLRPLSCTECLCTTLISLNFCAKFWESQAPPPEVAACSSAAGSTPVLLRGNTLHWRRQWFPEMRVMSLACDRDGAEIEIEEPAAELLGPRLQLDVRPSEQPAILLSLRKGRLNSRLLTPEHQDYDCIQHCRSRRDSEPPRTAITTGCTPQ